MGQSKIRVSTALLEQLLHLNENGIRIQTNDQYHSCIFVSKYAIELPIEGESVPDSPWVEAVFTKTPESITMELRPYD